VDTEALVQALSDARAALSGGLDGATHPERGRTASALAAVERAEAALRAAGAGTERTAEPGEAPSRVEPKSRGEAQDHLAALEARIGELSREVALHNEFLSTLGHELRNPLAPLFMQAQYLLDAVRHGDPKALSREWLEPQLEGFCRRLKKFLVTLERLMDLSRMSAGQLSLELEEFDLVALVRDVAASFERELSAARSDLLLDLPPHMVGVWDRMRIEQIVSNLLSNAIRYGASRPIEVTLGGDLEQIELVVKDHGIGIPAADRERIFHRFERAGKTRSSGGFGIGLWTVQKSCEAMGGRVSVKSQPGIGSEFTVMLPRVTEKDPREK
jgi:signal transduction histidine kinase